MIANSGAASTARTELRMARNSPPSGCRNMNGQT